ncbi:hypothetical protein FF38_08467, partial [Lucilia cuprina]
ALGVKTKGQVPVKVKTWSYELKSITSETSDAEKLKVDLEIERIARGVFAISGKFFFNVDVAEGDSNMIAAKSFRSPQGDNDYKVLPFQMPATHLYKVLNTHYKDVLMETLKDCSDFPVFENTFEPPMEKKLYTLDSCQFSQDGLPNHLQDGFYKLLIIGSGEVDWNVEVIAEVTQEL